MNNNRDPIHHSLIHSVIHFFNRYSLCGSRHPGDRKKQDRQASGPIGAYIPVRKTNKEEGDTEINEMISDKNKC